MTFKQELTEREVLLLTSAGQNQTGIDIGLNPFMTKCIEIPLSKEDIQSQLNELNSTENKIIYKKYVYEEVYARIQTT